MLCPWAGNNSFVRVLVPFKPWLFLMFSLSDLIHCTTTPICSIRGGWYHVHQFIRDLLLRSIQFFIRLETVIRSCYRSGYDFAITWTDFCSLHILDRCAWCSPLCPLDQVHSLQTLPINDPECLAWLCPWVWPWTTRWSVGPLMWLDDRQNLNWVTG